jgi:hypothetical protein
MSRLYREGDDYDHPCKYCGSVLIVRKANAQFSGAELWYLSAKGYGPSQCIMCTAASSIDVAGCQDGTVDKDSLGIELEKEILVTLERINRK